MGDKELSDAGKAVDRLDALFRRARVAGVAEGNVGDIDGFLAAMDDDFDTPAALAFVFDLVRRANTALDAGDTPAVASLLATVRELAGSFGLDIDDGDRAVTSGTASAADAEIDALVVARDEARARRDFAEADRIRDELKARGITLEDGPGGTTWHR